VSSQIFPIGYLVLSAVIHNEMQQQTTITTTLHPFNSLLSRKTW